MKERIKKWLGIDRLEHQLLEHVKARNVANPVVWPARLFCARCGSEIKPRALDTGDGWLLFADCDDQCFGDHQMYFDDPFPGNDELFIGSIELKRAGFDIV